METARVDIRKLQLLNDRISQCLDALAQVRLSVHGLSHSQTNQQQGFGPQQAFGPQQGFGQQAYGPQQGYGPQQSFFGQQQSPFAGLSHSPFQQLGPQQQGYWPQQIGAFGNQQSPFGQQNPILAQQLAQGGLPQMQGAWGQTPFSGIGGLSHSGIDIESLYARPLWSDPMLQARVRETFPYLASMLPPVVSLF